MAKNDPKVGDVVTCKHEVEAHYSGFNGNPRWMFTPGTPGTVAAIVPKVRIVGGSPIHDRRDMFLVVDYVCLETQGIRRVGLNFCNARKYHVT